MFGQIRNKKHHNNVFTNQNLKFDFEHWKMMSNRMHFCFNSILFIRFLRNRLKKICYLNSSQVNN